MIVSIANQKGGVAKSTTAINLAAGLSIQGFKVLLIDIDPQCNTTRVFIHGDDEICLKKSLYNTILNFAPLSGIIQKTHFNNLSFVPSHIRLSSADLELAQAFDNRSERLKRALAKVKDQYDYIIIDNPPSLGLLTINAFVASDKLVIPVSTGFFALTGLVQLQESIDMVKQTQLNPNLDILGVLCTFSDRTNVSKDVENQLRDYFGDLVFKTVIPKNIIQDFPKVFDAKLVLDYQLSRSFRFGPLIAQCAANVIVNNTNRVEKPLIAIHMPSFAL